MLLLLLLIGLPHAASADAFLALRAGAQLWPDTSNGAELEADHNPGPALGLAAGFASSFGLPSWFDLALELEALHLTQPLHGRNRSSLHDSADDHWLQVASLSLGVWPGVHLGERFTAYAGVSLGASWLHAFSDDASAPQWQLGAGLLASLTPSLALEAAYRRIETTAHLSGFRASYDAHGVLIGLRWSLRDRH